MLVTPSSVSQVERVFAYMFIEGGYIRAIVRNICGEDILNDPDKYSRFLSLFLNRYSSILFPIGKVVLARTYYYDAIVPVEDHEKYIKQKTSLISFSSI